MSVASVWGVIGRSTLYGVLFLLPSLAQARAAKPIDPAFFALNDCPSLPGCAAVVLLEETELNNEGQRTTYSYHRLLKVFTEDGIEAHADVELSASVGDFVIRNLKGRTILPDGTELTLEQSNIKVSTLKKGKRHVRSKTAKFPGVVPGAIIEHSWDIVAEPFHFITGDTWLVQKEIPVMTARYSLKPGRYKLIWVASGAERVPISEKVPWKGLQVLEATNVPPLSNEPQGPPEGAIRARVHIAMPESQGVWLGAFAGQVAGKSGDFIDKGAGVAEKVAELVSPSDTPLDRVRKIYRFVQESIASEEARAAGTEESATKEAEGVGDVLARRFGTEYERTLLFLAMVKRAGLEHGLLILAGRFSSAFDSTAPDTDQFDSFAAAVKTGTGWTFYDPATRYCPFGMLAPEKEGGVQNGILLTPQAGAGKSRDVRVKNLVSLQFSSAPYSIVTVPASAASRNGLTRLARVTLSGDGAATVEASETGTGLADLTHRERYAALDAEKRKEALTDRLRETFPDHEMISHGFEEIESFDKPATLRYTLKIPSLAQSAGDRILVTPSLYGAFTANPYTAESRRTAVLLPHASVTRTTVRVEIPDGYEVQEMPAAAVLRDPPFVFTLAYTTEGNILVLTRRVEIDAISWPAADYLRLKTFAAKLKEADNQIVVLVKKPS